MFSCSRKTTARSPRRKCSNNAAAIVRKPGFWKAEIATDVRSENALVSEATGMIHPIDFIVAGLGA